MPLGFAKAVFNGGGAINETVLDFGGLSASNTNNGQLFLGGSVIKDDLGITAGSKHFAEQSGGAGSYKVSNNGSDVSANARDVSYIPLKAGTYEFEITSITGTFRHRVQEAWNFNIQIQAGISTYSGSGSRIDSDSPTRKITIPVSHAEETDDLSTLTGAGTVGNIPNGTGFTNEPFSEDQPFSALPLVMGDVVLGGLASDTSLISGVSYVGTNEIDISQNMGLAVTFNVTASAGIATSSGTVRITLRNT